VLTGVPRDVRMLHEEIFGRWRRSALLRTMVQPAATAGPILRVPIAIAKSHGVISRLGPTASAAAAWAGFPLADPVIGLVITVAILLVLRDAAREVYRRLMGGVHPVLWIRPSKPSVPFRGSWP
jgi:hypothetical protein